LGAVCASIPWCSGAACRRHAPADRAPRGPASRRRWRRRRGLPEPRLERKLLPQIGGGPSHQEEPFPRRHARPKKKPRSIEKDEALLRLYILPALGSRKLAAITAADVARLHRDLGGRPVQANRAVALLSNMCSLAEVWDVRPRGSNPCRGLRRYAERRRERFLSYSELSRLGETLAAVEAEGRELPSVILAIRLLALTGARRDEILTLRWDYVDLERGVLRLPDSKTGAKVIPLGAAAVQLLAATPRLKDKPYVCTGYRTGGHPVGLQYPWERIRERAFPV
jgi:integrase